MLGVSLYSVCPVTGQEHCSRAVPSLAPSFSQMTISIAALPHFTRSAKVANRQTKDVQQQREKVTLKNILINQVVTIGDSFTLMLWLGVVFILNYVC